MGSRARPPAPAQDQVHHPDGGAGAQEDEVGLLLRLADARREEAAGAQRQQAGRLFVRHDFCLSQHFRICLSASESFLGRLQQAIALITTVLELFKSDLGKF